MTVARRPDGRLLLEDSVPPPWVGTTMTLEAFLSLPTVKPNLEYTDGPVTQKVAGRPTRGSLLGLLACSFNDIAGPLRLGLAFLGTRFVTPTWAPVPDVSYYRREHIKRDGNRPPSDFFETPDLAVEIASPEQSVTKLIEKCLRYVAVGIAVKLLVDPDQETVLAFRPEQPLRVLQGGDRIDLDDVLPGFELTVSEMFSTLALDWLDDEAAEPPSSGPATI